MGTFSRIARHEWRTLSRERTVWVSIVVLALAIVYAIWNGATLSQAQQEAARQFAQWQESQFDTARQKLQNMERRLAEGLTVATLPNIEQVDFNFGPRLPYWVNTFNPVYAMLPPAPLAALAVGQSDLYPPAIAASNSPVAQPVETIENPLKLLIGYFDLARVMLYLYPLLILALSYDLLATERENGTLRLLLAQPVRLRTLVLGKIAVRARVIFASVSLFSVAGFLLSGINLSAEGVAVKLLWWVVAVIAYGAFWFALAVLVEGLGRSAATNAIILVVCWLALVVLLPSAIHLAATAIYPAPSRAEFVDRGRVAREELAQRTPDELLSGIMADYPLLTLNTGSLDPNKPYRLIEARRDALERELKPLQERFDIQLAQQHRLVNRLRLLSPAILLQDVLYALAGADADRQQRFLAQANQYKQRWKDFFVPRQFSAAAFSSSDFDLIPRFTFREEPLGEVTRRILSPLAALVMLTLIIGFFGLRAYRHYQMVG